MPKQTTDIVIACCRDEADLISSFIDFYVDQGFDRICLIDNGSQDSTVDKILNHPSRNKILLLNDQRLGYDTRLLEYYHFFANYASRWVFFLDVDEFVSLPGGIKNYADRLPPEVTVLQLHVAEMLPPTNSRPLASPLLSTKREASFQKEKKVVWKNTEVTKIYCGKHDIQAQPYVAHQEDNVIIRHFHSRSEQQFRRKLLNRLQTESAFKPGEADSLSAFSPDRRRDWIDQSRRMLEPDGWEIERQRLESVPWETDSAIADWMLNREATEELQVSPMISLRAEGTQWQCFCVRELQGAEGHTAGEHLVLVHAPGRPLTGFDDIVFSTFRHVPVRIHSECLLGDIFGSDRCDCAHQLSTSLAEIEKTGHGVVIYLRQEGRGLGMFDKIRSLTVANNNSFSRNEALGLPADARDYRLAARMLNRLGIRSVRLLSGNPEKSATLEAMGIETSIDCLNHPPSLSTEALNEFRAKVGRGYKYTSTLEPERMNTGELEQH